MIIYNDPCVLVIIRNACMEDIIWLKERDKHIDESTLKDKINHFEVYIAEIDENKVGWLRYNLFWDNVPFLNMICVLEKYHRIGIGTLLINYWENEMKTNCYKSVMTSTQSNEEAQHFFRKMRYKEIGGFKYFEDPFEIILLKVLE